MSLLEYSTSYVPIYHNIVELTKMHEDMHWVESDANLHKDVEDWKIGNLADHEKNLITNILLLFTQSDVNVSQDYVDNLLPVFKNNEVRNMLVSFSAREGIHQRAYALLNDTLGFPEDTYHEFLDYHEMKEKHEFMLDVNNRSYRDIGIGIAKQVMIEGVCLFASFAMLLNFQRFGKMTGMCEISSWSLKDESIHIQGLVELFRLFTDEHPRIVNDEFKKEIYECARKTIEIEDAFIDKAFELGPVEGLTKDEVKQYIRHVCDYRMRQLGFKRQFGIKENPLPWVDWVTSSSTIGSFFEVEVTEYSKNSMVGSYNDAYSK